MLIYLIIWLEKQVWDSYMERDDPLLSLFFFFILHLFYPERLDLFEWKLLGWLNMTAILFEAQTIHLWFDGDSRGIYPISRCYSYEIKMKSGDKASFNVCIMYELHAIPFVNRTEFHITKQHTDNTTFISGRIDTCFVRQQTSTRSSSLPLFAPIILTTAYCGHIPIVCLLNSHHDWKSQNKQEIDFNCTRQTYRIRTASVRRTHRMIV